eukprot:TRINITY_DN8328_c0_g1_i1.p1 TRINITY_DN8328_c0_g1~~TRINITY_DN8328_c0_g1_i1.p1  ORF type:complete len:332 (-),score=44.55 TRINITY_DN8328_c0_g1_i1:120-1115(-)
MCIRDSTSIEAGLTINLRNKMRTSMLNYTKRVARNRSPLTKPTPRNNLRQTVRPSMRAVLENGSSKVNVQNGSFNCAGRKQSVKAEMNNTKIIRSYHIASNENRSPYRNSTLLPRESDISTLATIENSALENTKEATPRSPGRCLPNAKTRRFTLETLLAGLKLSEFTSLFTENGIKTEDLLLLDREDMKELKFPLYARNRVLALQEYLKQTKEVIIGDKGLLHDVIKEIYHPELSASLKTNCKREPERVAHGLNAGDEKANGANNMQDNESIIFAEEDAQEEIRDFHKEYYKASKSPMKNCSTSKSERHKGQLEKYRAELDSIIGAMHNH